MKAIPGGVSYKCYPLKKVNDPGKDMTAKGGPRDTSGGMDLGKNATNSRGKWSNKMLSPNADANNRNKG